MNRILIADDAEINRLYLRGLLEAHGYDVVEACDGLEALQAVREFRPDLAIIDASMPNMDGLEFIRRLRPDTEIGSTQVMLWSASDSHLAARIATEYRVGLLEKPCEPGKLLEAIERALRVRPVMVTH